MNRKLRNDRHSLIEQTYHGIGINDLVDKFTHSLLQAFVALDPTEPLSDQAQGRVCLTDLLVIRAVESCSQPTGLRVRNRVDDTRSTAEDLRLLILDCANHQALILWLLKHFVSMETIECFCGILSHC